MIKYNSVSNSTADTELFSDTFGVEKADIFVPNIIFMIFTQIADMQISFGKRRKENCY